MIATSDLAAIARSRLREARALFKSRHYDGSAYLCGYAIEVALKANEFFEKIKSIGNEIEAEVGGVVLFGVFKRAETPGWDVIISADWVGEDNIPAIYYVVPKFQKSLDVEEMVSISRFEPLPPSNDFVKSVLNAVRVTDEGVYFEYRAFNGILMSHAYIAIANPDSHSHAPLPLSTARVSARASIRRAAEKTKRRTGTGTKPRQR